MEFTPTHVNREHCATLWWAGTHNKRIKEHSHPGPDRKWDSRPVGQVRVMRFCEAHTIGPGPGDELL